MGIRLHIRASEVEATAKAWGLAGYTVEPFNAKLWGCNPDWVMTDVMLVMGEGRVVGLRERNMHDDSDFFVTYQTDAGVFVEREYATTRGWSYPNEAHVDAPEGVQERYRAALRAAARYARAVRMLDVRAKRRERLRAAGIVLRDYQTSACRGCCRCGTVDRYAGAEAATFDVQATDSGADPCVAAGGRAAVSNPDYPATGSGPRP